MMIWGYMTASRLGCVNLLKVPYVIATKYQQILQNSLLPSIVKLNVDKNYIFQKDQTTCNEAITTKQWFGAHKSNVFAWISNSSDPKIIDIK